jgi:hypothetical protein
VTENDNDGFREVNESDNAKSAICKEVNGSGDEVKVNVLDDEKVNEMNGVEKVSENAHDENAYGV